MSRPEPGIRGSQFESTSTGSLQNAVNLFRGDLNYRLPLVNLRGKQGDKNLTVQLTALYQSNVSQQVTRWNRDVPTGTLGVGWSLPLERIEIRDTGGVVHGQMLYDYVSQGSPQPLIPAPESWERASLDPAMASHLTAGSTVGEALSKAFAEQGLALDESASVEGEGPWSVRDNVQEHLWTLVLNDSALVVKDGGRTYQLASYNFWKICYYEPFERWEVTDESGMLKVYGGGVSQVHGVNASKGNSVGWSVKWGGKDGSWTGNAPVTDASQTTQYASCWYLERQQDRWGDAVCFGYNEFGRNEDGLLGKATEQRFGGPTGKPFTKACYLTSVTDVFGRKVTLHYEDKIFTNNVQEFNDPHKVLIPVEGGLPSNLTSPNAWQDRYETQLLRSLSLSAVDGTRLYDFNLTYSKPIDVNHTPAGVNVQVDAPAGASPSQLSLSVDGVMVSYQPKPSATASEIALGLRQACLADEEFSASIICGELKETGFRLTQRNLSDLASNKVVVSGTGLCAEAASAGPVAHPEERAGLHKRYLLAVTEIGARGVPQPGFLMDYYWNTEGPNLGALKTMTFPQGGQGSFQYADRKLEICHRETLIHRPAENAIPKIWFGQDYAVVGWLDLSRNKVFLQIWNWEGRWVLSHVADDDVIYDNLDAGSSLKPDSFQCLTERRTVALSFSNAKSSYLYLYQRDSLRAAAWTPYIDSDSDAPLGAHVFPNIQSLTLTGGNRFVLVQSDGGVSRFTHSWQKGVWVLHEEQSLPGVVTSFLASENSYLRLDYRYQDHEGCMIRHFLDDNETWVVSDSRTLSMNLSKQNAMMVWASGPSLVTWAEVQQGTGPGNGEYSQHVLTWDAKGRFSDQTDFENLTVSDVTTIPDLNWPPQPAVVNNQLIASNRNFFRRTASDWHQTSFPQVGGTLNWVTYATGNDYVLQTVNRSNGVSTLLSVFDADQGKWAAPVPLKQPEFDGPMTEQGFPSAAGEDWFAAANGLFYRGSSPVWSEVEERRVMTLDGQMDTRSGINQSPSFLALLNMTNQVKDSQVVLNVIQNGRVREIKTLDGQLYFNPNVPNLSPNLYLGNGPAGLSSMLTFPAKFGNFSNTPYFRLYHFAGEHLTGPINHKPITAMTIDNGYGELKTTVYEFDTAQASCDAQGKVVKYYKSTTKNLSLGKQNLGRTVALFLNDARAGGFDMLDGQQLQTLYFKGSLLRSTTWNKDLGLDPFATPNEKPKPVPAALSALLGNLSSEATLQFVKLETTVGQDTKHLEGYAYWVIDDPVQNVNYNIDYNDLPEASDAVKIYDGRVTQILSYDWHVYSHRNAKPDVVAPIRLFGGFALQTAKTTWIDGVPLRNEFSYVPPSYASDKEVSAPFSTGVQTSSWSVVDGDGKTQESRHRTVYGAQTTPALFAMNSLQKKAFVGLETKIGDRWELVNGKYKSFGIWTTTKELSIYNESATWKWSGGTKVLEQLPADPSTDKHWILDSRVCARSKRGMILESQDAAKTKTANLFDQRDNEFVGQVALLHVKNASLVGDEAMFCGFGADEDLSAWTLTGKAVFDESNAHTGRQSLHLFSESDKAQRMALSPTRQNIPYMVSCWYRLSESSNGSALLAKVSANNSPIGDPVVLAFDGEPGRWNFVMAPLDLSTYASTVGGATLDVVFETQMQSNGELWIDDVKFCPLSSEFHAMVHDPKTRLQTARMNQTIGCHTRGYDGSQQPTMKATKTHVPKNLLLKFGSRQTNSPFSWLEDQGGPVPPLPSCYRFNPERPNLELRIRAEKGGSFQQFLDPEQWTEDWQPDNATHWTSQGGRLVGSGVLTSRSKFIDSLALSMNLDEPPGSGFTLSLGENHSFQWDGSQWHYGQAKPLQTSAGAPHSLLLVFMAGKSANRLLFFHNQQLLFVDNPSTGGAPTIHTGNQNVTIRNLALLEGVSIHQVQKDGNGTTRQTHVLGADEYYVVQSVTNALSKPVVKTKAVPGLFGSGAVLPLLAYRPGLVEMSEFHSALSGSGVMKGDAADYYDGSDLENGRTDDGGYPYYRKRYEPAPNGRLVERGRPGSANAIINPFTSDPASRPTTRTVFGNDQSVEHPFQVPTAGSYAVTLQFDPTGALQATLKDAKQQQLFQIKRNKGMEMQTAWSSTYNELGVKVTEKLPNAFLGLQSSDQQLRVSQFDSLGHLLSLTGPDQGTTQQRNDANGRLRFVQNAQAASKGYVTYTTYDSLGRKTSTGTVKCSWDEVLTHLDDAMWPVNSSASWKQRAAWSYDGDGHDAYAVGQTTSAFTVTGADVISGDDGFVTVAENFTYGPSGKPTHIEQTTHWSDGVSDGPFQLCMDYDNQKKLVQLTYPEVVDLGAVGYGRDDLGRVQTVSLQGKTLADVRYASAGKPLEVVFEESGVRTQFEWDSLERITQVGMGSSAEQRWRTSYVYSSDGILQTQQDQFDNDSGSLTLSQEFGHDGLNRMKANGEGGSGFSYVLESGTSDLNGNLQSGSNREVNWSHVYSLEGSNRLEQIRDNKATIQFGYSDNGIVTSKTSQPSAPNDWKVTLIQGQQLPASMDLASGDTLQFAYNHEGARVGKRVRSKDSDKRWSSILHGHQPLFLVDELGLGSAFVQSSLGLLAMRQGGQTFLVAQDGLKSIRALFDASGKQVGAWSHDPYGRLNHSWSKDSLDIPLKFTGQAFDHETGLYNFNARLYDPTMGRFLSPDPQQQYGSPYAYAGGLPNQLNDPTGLASPAGITGAADLVLMGIGFAIGVLVPVTAPASITNLWLVSSAIFSAGSGGLFYDVMHHNDWSESGFLEASVIGLISGAVFGRVAGSIIGNETKAVKDIVAASEDSVDDLLRSFEEDFSEDEIEVLIEPEQDDSTVSYTDNVKKVFCNRIEKRMKGYTAGYAASEFVNYSLTNLMQGKILPDQGTVFWTVAMGEAGTWMGVGSAAVSSAFAVSNEMYGVLGTLQRLMLTPSEVQMIEEGSLFIVPTFFPAM